MISERFYDDLKYHLAGEICFEDFKKTTNQPFYTLKRLFWVIKEKEKEEEKELIKYRFQMDQLSIPPMAILKPAVNICLYVRINMREQFWEMTSLGKSF